MNISARIFSRVYKECGSQRYTSNHPRGDREDVAVMHPGSSSHRQILSSQRWSPREEEEARFGHGCRSQPSSGGPYHTIFRTVASTSCSPLHYHRFLNRKSSLPQHRPPFERAHDGQTTSQRIKEKESGLSRG